MQTKLKYIKSKTFNGIVMFPDYLQHSQFKNLEPISAGFCYIDNEKQEIICYGGSIGLSLKSDENDSAIATRQYFPSKYYNEIE